MLHCTHSHGYGSNLSYTLLVKLEFMIAKPNHWALKGVMTFQANISCKKNG